MLSVGTIRFEDRFCASKKGGIGGGGRVSAWGAVHMAAALAGHRTALVGTGRTHLVSMGCYAHGSCLVSGCGWGHKPTDNVPVKVWVKISVLAPSRSENTDQKMYP